MYVCINININLCSKIPLKLENGWNDLVNSCLELFAEVQGSYKSK